MPTSGSSSPAPTGRSLAGPPGSILRVEPWLVVWLVNGLVSIGVLLVLLAFLIRHVILLGRTARRLQEELQPIADELAAGSARAADTAARFSGRAAGTARRQGRR
jgi:hypothetical protein